MNTVLWRNLCRAAALFAALLLLSGALSPTAQAVGETGSISVVKSWEGEEEKPGSITLSLVNGGQPVQSIVLSAADAAADGSWQGRFENIPLYDGGGNSIQYSISEEPVEGWKMSLERLPSAETLTLGSIGEKITPASEQSYSIGSSNMLAANKGNNYYIWTFETLSEGQRLRLLSEINRAKLQGFGKKLSLDNTAFQSGLPTEFDGGVGLRQEDGAVWVDFQRSSVWSLFYAGSIRLTKEQSALLVNRPYTQTPTPTATPSPTPEPTQSPMPSFTPTPAPTPFPTEPPKTGDSGIGGCIAVLVCSLSAAPFILLRLKKR